MAATVGLQEEVPCKSTALKCVDQPGNEREEQQKLEQLPVAATTDRTPTHATAITHQDARNHGATTQSSTPDKKYQPHTIIPTDDDLW